MAGNAGRMAGDMGRMAGNMGRVFGEAAAQMAGGMAQMAGNMTARQQADMAAGQGLPLYDKHPAKASCVVMMALGYPLMGLGLFFSAVFAFCVAVAGAYFVAPLVIFIMMAIAGIALGVSGTKKFKMLGRFSKYTYRLEEHAYVAVSDLANKVGKSVAFTMKDLEKMIRQHLFYQAHLDYENNYLILSDRTYEQYKMAREDYRKEQEEKKYPFELRFYESSPLAVEDLLNGRIQAALMDELPANNAIENGRAVKKAGTHGDPDNFGVAMRKDDKELQKLVNEGYKKLMADPYWKELQQKYLSK